MRKWAGLVLVFLGAFLLIAGIVAKVWGPGLAERTPLNVNTFTYLTGTADKLNSGTGEVETDLPVKYLSVTRADPNISDGDYVAFVNTKCVNIDQDDPPACLDENDDRLITNTVDTFATDRHTAMATDKSQYLAKDAVPHEGLVNKWPFNTEKKTYPYWNGILGTTVDAEYVGTKDYDGLETYEFSTEVAETPAEVLDGVQGIYSTNETIWVDPRTGSIIDQEGGQVLKLETGDLILDINVAYTDDTVATNVEDAKANRKTLTILLDVLPPVGVILGLLMLVAGGLMIRRSHRSGDHAADDTVSLAKV
ncbi:DUF3068 domain-containing protein [Nocardioides sp.]|uniref:DUF3068 domain-containing protein n=1 Tax=Nocardioides sp. TaxID=35761 RepID=UPI003D0B75DA